jgi:chromosome segregation ATPase
MSSWSKFLAYLHGYATYESADEWLMAEHNDGSAPESGVSDSKEHVTPESCRQDADQVEHAESADCENDSREKLEDDIQSDLAALSEYGKLMLDWGVVMDWLDRQAAITKREMEDTFLDRADKVITRRELVQRELQEQITTLQGNNEQLHTLAGEQATRIDDLQQQVDDYRAEWHRVCKERMNLAHDLGTCMAERDKLQAKISKIKEVANE